MQIIITGMRRSGTTILYDVLYGDKQLDAYYEPLGVSQRTIGGGSGVRGVTYFDKLRSARMKFLEQYPGLQSPEMLNYGARRDFRLELEPGFPDYIKEYFRFLADGNSHTLFKLVRTYFKTRALHEIFPEAKLIHIYKDPRRQAVSHIQTNRKGKNLPLRARIKKRARRFYRNLNFFGVKSNFNFWSAEDVVNEMIRREPELKPYQNAPAYLKLMLLWKRINSSILEEGHKYFRDNFLSLKHEALCMQPVKHIRHIYTFLGLTLPEDIEQWAEHHIQPPRPIYKVNAKHWEEAAAELSIDLSEWREYENG